MQLWSLAVVPNSCQWPPHSTQGRPNHSTVPFGCYCAQVNPNTIFVDSSPFKGAAVDTPELYVKRWGWIGDPR